MFHIYLSKCKKIRPLITIKYRTWVFNTLYKVGLLANIYCTGKVKVIQSLNIQGKGRLILNDGCMLGVYPSPNLYNGEFYLEARRPESIIKIGKRVLINNNAVIIADKSSITIGDDSLIGPNFVCFDSNFHPLAPDKRLSQDYKCKPVKIGSNVFIGANVTILKGVTVGDNSIISSGLIISSDIPSNVIVRNGTEVKLCPFE
ncbi:transferase [Aliivibrio fischeri]|uniref:DapH/DapD/GlmU-related protein n=1 Tax=Aliivibrio fischeri TaxID=668 RepID=UPI0012D9EB6F|nr:DapH/DapD/GlmU-related protein [Aliivibrio fischeri]MUK77056.1 transferase [Aliivibrio fischeri]